MISEEVIVANPSNCVFDDVDGYAPGCKYISAVEERYPTLFELKTNGVAFIAKRTVFYSGGIGDPTVECADCGKRFKWNDSWSAAVEEWFDNRGPGVLACEHCGVPLPITEWRHDPPWAFGNVGVKFWNWPRLRPDFVKAMSDLVGHRFRMVYGKF